MWNFLIFRLRPLFLPDFLLLFLLLHDHRPLAEILLTIGELNVLDGGGQVGQLAEDGEYTEVDEPILATGDVSGVTVAQEWDIDASLLLSVTLDPELFVEEVSPDLADIEISQWRADVACVEHDTWKEAFAHFCWLSTCLINNICAFLTSLNTFPVHEVLKVILQSLARGHISLEDEPQDALLHEPYLLLGVDVSYKVALLKLDKLHGLSGMEVLLDVLVTECLLEGWLVRLVEGIGETIVLHVVAEAGHKDSDSVEGVELCITRYLLFVHHEAEVLGNVSSVEVIMIMNMSLVTVVNHGDEGDELVPINQLVKPIQLENTPCCHWHVLISAQFLTESKQIEVEVI